MNDGNSRSDWQKPAERHLLCQVFHYTATLQRLMALESIPKKRMGSDKHHCHAIKKQNKNPLAHRPATAENRQSACFKCSATLIGAAVAGRDTAGYFGDPDVRQEVCEMTSCGCDRFAHNSVAVRDVSMSLVLGYAARGALRASECRNLLPFKLS